MIQELVLNINSIQFAFVAGFIQADGHITKSGNIEITIAKKDKHLLEWICHTFQLNASKIKIQKRIDKRTGKTSDQAKLKRALLVSSSFDFTR